MSKPIARSWLSQREKDGNEMKRGDGMRRHKEVGLIRSTLLQQSLIPVGSSRNISTIGLPPSRSHSFILSVPAPNPSSPYPTEYSDLLALVEYLALPYPNALRIVGIERRIPTQYEPIFPVTT